MTFKWEDLVPEHVARQQRAWERNARECCAKNLGMTLREVEKLFGISAERARQLIAKHARARLSPIERWATDKDEYIEM